MRNVRAQTHARVYSRHAKFGSDVIIEEARCLGECLRGQTAATDIRLNGSDPMTATYMREYFFPLAKRTSILPRASASLMCNQRSLWFASIRAHTSPRFLWFSGIILGRAVCSLYTFTGVGMRSRAQECVYDGMGFFYMGIRVGQFVRRKGESRARRRRRCSIDCFRSPQGFVFFLTAVERISNCETNAYICLAPSELLFERVRGRGKVSASCLEW